MKAFVIAVALLAGPSLYAAKTYTATGRANGYVCQYGPTADCDNAQRVAKNSAMNACYAEGNANCTLVSLADLEWGGACGAYVHNDYCISRAVVSGQ